MGDPRVHVIHGTPTENPLGAHVKPTGCAHSLFVHERPHGKLSWNCSWRFPTDLFTGSWEARGVYQRKLHVPRDAHQVPTKLLWLSHECRRIFLGPHGQIVNPFSEKPKDVNGGKSCDVSLRTMGRLDWPLTIDPVAPLQIRRTRCTCGPPQKTVCSLCEFPHYAYGASSSPASTR